MKKFLSVVIIIALLFTLTGCDSTLFSELNIAENESDESTINSSVLEITSSTTDVCTHVWGQWTEKTSATCTKNGVKERTCFNCEKTDSEEIAKLNHNESDWIIDKVAKIAQEGYKYTKCTYCDKKIKEEAIPAISEEHTHSGTTWVTTKNATCTKNGSKSNICSCGKTIETKEISAKGHTVVIDKDTAPTCTTNGISEGSHCSICGTIIVKQEKLSAKGHNMASKTVSATSTEPEYTLHYCTQCSHSYKEIATPSSPIKFQSNNNGTCRVTGLNDTTLENVVIPEKSPSGDVVVAIGEGAFKNNTTLKSVSFPSTLKEIGKSAFSTCKNLKSVTGSNYVATIGEYAFMDCSALTELDLSAASTMGNYVCRRCSNLSSVKLSAELKSLPGGMFASCTSLLEVDLPSKIAKIGNAAFQSTNIESIILPDSVEEIEMYAFRYCGKLKSIKLSKNLKIINPMVFENCTNLSNVTLPEGLETLDRLAFTNCTSITSMTIPNTVTTIGDSCFYNCSGLVSVVLPSKIKIIPSSLFYGCNSLTNITLPSGITKIERYAFFNTSITKLAIPHSCTSIGNSAFSGCKSLASVTFGINLKTIDSYAFSGCKVLTEVSLPNTFADLGDWAFSNCTSLKKVYLGTKITNIGSGAFENCTALSNVFLPKSLQVIKTETYDKNPFTGCSGTLNIYSDAPQSNYVWERYFGLVSYGVSYDEYLKLTQ